MGTVGGAPSESRSRLPTAEKIGNWLRASVLANLPYLRVRYPALKLLVGVMYFILELSVK